MKIEKLTDHALHNSTVRAAREEREKTFEVIRHLREVDRRRYYSAIGLPSIYAYAIEVLGYSEDEAYYRISSLRVMVEIPEIEPKVESGALSLTNLCLARSAFRRGEFTRAEKLTILLSLENKSSREAKKILVSHAPIPTRVDRVTQITPDKMELRFVVSVETYQKLERLKGRLAHKSPNISLGELMDKLCDLALDRWVPRDATRRRVFEKAGYRCEGCGSYYALEADHRLPRALGGERRQENLRALCRSCNQRAAIEVFGLRKMSAFINKI